MKRYGTPYMGSKNQIAEWVYSHFPKATNFYDLFAGGCAITHIALEKGEFKNYICNDIDNGGIRLFVDAVNGKFADETRWISRQDFFRLKDKDPYVRFCWSFGNNGRDYLYSKQSEPYKKAVHCAVCQNDFSFAESLGLNLKSIEPLQGIRNRYSAVKLLLKESRVLNIERQQSLQSLQSLQALQALQSLQQDYSQVEIQPDSVIYCDLPYKDTNGYGKAKKNSFDFERFYSWALEQKELLIISEYQMPLGFVCIDEIEKKVTMNSDTVTKRIERIFIPKQQIEMYAKRMNTLKKQLEFNFCEVA